MVKFYNAKATTILLLFMVAGISQAGNHQSEPNLVSSKRQVPCHQVTDPLPNLTVSSGMQKGTAFFAHDSILISQPFVNLIAKHAEILSQNSQLCVFMAGFSDPTGSSSYNQQLSLKRASEVAKMMTYLGVLPSQISQAGYGEQIPRTKNNTDSFTESRRVDWVFQN
jgi:outer membrane protein OmpA-like peptidoglycan-associated protein